LTDQQSEKPDWYADYARDLAVDFCAALPSVFSSSLERLTMWDKIGAAIRSGYAKTASGDLDLFVNHVLESILAEPSRVAACEPLMKSLDAIQQIPMDSRQDWLRYLVTHLMPVLMYARQQHKFNMESKQQ
jgi:hypothetical protein